MTLQSDLHVQFSHDTYGTFIASFKAGQEPLWHGLYETAILTLYLAEITGTPKVALGVIYFVIADKYNSTLDMVGHTVYNAHSTSKQVIDATMEYIGKAYAEHLLQACEKGMLDGTVTRQ